jgi:hypothetical protein
MALPFVRLWRGFAAISVRRVQLAVFRVSAKLGGFHPMCAKQNQQDLLSAFGTLILERLATAGAFLS